MSATPNSLPGPGPPWAALVERVAAGDSDAVQALSTSFARLKGYFHKHVGPEDVEDMFHDLLVVLVKQIQNGALEDPERLPGYVFAIARWQIASQVRLRMRARRTVSVDDVKLFDHVPDAETSLARKELWTIARQVLEGLPVQQREMLIRFYLQEQRPGEIQEALGITETQFRLVKSRAKARFAELCRKAMKRKPVAH